MKRVSVLLLLMMTISACGQLAQQPQIVPTLRPTNVPVDAPPDATEMATAEAPLEATETTQATVEATEPIAEATDAPVEATAETTEVAMNIAEVAMAGDAALGEELFMHGAHGVVPCASCHDASSDVRQMGPGLLTVAARAETRVAGLTAAEYLKQSIVDPSALVVASFFNIMPKDFSAQYSDAEIDALVAYLLTLNQPGHTEIAANIGQG
jgi:cytochrome c2